MKANKLNAEKITFEILTPAQFLNLSQADKINISETQIIPPQLGEVEFGKIRVIYKFPIFKVENER